MTSQWTPEAIRALGATTDLPTLGSIFGLGPWRSYQMAHTGEWEQAGIRILKIGNRYRVAVPSILDVLGNGGARRHRYRPGARSCSPRAGARERSRRHRHRAIRPGGDQEQVMSCPQEIGRCGPHRQAAAVDPRQPDRYQGNPQDLPTRPYRRV